MRIFLYLLLVVSVNVWSNTLENLLELNEEFEDPSGIRKNIHSMTYRLHIKEPDFELNGIYRVTRSGQMRIDIYDGESRVFTEAFDGERGWQWHPEMNAAKVIHGEKAQALVHGIQLPGKLYVLKDLQAEGHKVELLGKEAKGDEDYHLIKVTLSDGFVKYYLMNPASGTLEVNRDFRAFHPDIDNTAIPIETRHKRWKDTTGMMKSYQSENWNLEQNKWLGTTTVNVIVFDETLPSDYFDISFYDQAVTIE